MEALTEREAIERFLAGYAAMMPLERRSRRIETVVVMLYAAVIVINVTIPATGGFHPVNLIGYAVACIFALTLRQWVIAAGARRRAWVAWQRAAATAQARLARLDELRQPEDDERERVFVG